MVEIEEIKDEGPRQRPAAGGPKVGGGAVGDVEDLSGGKGELLKKVLVAGTGEPCGNRSASVHYTGRFPDGRVFDSSTRRGTPFNFSCGRGEVIRGWDVGVSSMRKGEKVLLTCKPNYAYGASGAPPVIPPNATLEFEVELLGFGEETGGSGFGGLPVLLLAALAMAYYVYTTSPARL
jgi:FK506-binding protein 4/5